MSCTPSPIGELTSVSSSSIAHLSTTWCRPYIASSYSRQDFSPSALAWISNISTASAPQRRMSAISVASLTARISSTQPAASRSEEHTSELQSRRDLVCRLLLEKKKENKER